MKRRDFLRTSGCFIVTAGLAKLTGCGGCGDDDGNNPDAGPVVGTYSFPQGVASGDPQPTAVMLWTRAVLTDDSGGDVTVVAEISESESFDTIVAMQEMTVNAASDHTLRLLVEGLSPATWYYYRFTAGADVSRTGRTRTAPEANADVPVNMAWVSCQDYEAGFYGAYRQMIADDEAADPADQIQLVVHLGDFIYETRAAGFQGAIDDNYEPIQLTDRNGNPRVVPEYPSGGGTADGINFADTLDDYRHIYKTYLMDPDLQEARARWPFVNTWDDHEFTNDAWQSQANFIESDSYDEPSQNRKVASNQAWFEYIPALLTGASGVSGVTPEAKDFAETAVTDTAYDETDVGEDGFADEENNTKAVESMTIYRSLRYGANVDLVMTDERSYRSDHALPEDLTYNQTAFFDPRNVLILEMVNAMDAGREANGGNPPDQFFNTFDNPRKDSPPGTMLGPKQKAWWKATMMGSDATWKIWGNEVPLMRAFVKGEGILLADRIINGDAWDGYNYERKELMAFLRDNSIQNVVAITGDWHCHMAAQIYDDFDAATPTPVMTELIAAGIASNSVFSFFEKPTRTQPPQVRQIITYDSTTNGGTDKFVNTFNMSLLWGVDSSNTMAATNNVTMAEADKDPNANPHVAYADTDAQGYGLLKITSTEITGTLVTMNRPIVDSESGPGVKRTATFTISKDVPAVVGPTFTGTPPFPFSS